MPERWERELSKLRVLDADEPVVRDRVSRGPSSDGSPPRRDRVIAGMVAGAVAIGAAALLWQTLPGNPELFGNATAELPILSVSFHESEVVPEGPDSSYRRVQTTISYGDASDESFTSTTPPGAIAEWVAAQDLTPFLPGPTVGSRIEFEADGDRPRVLLGRPRDWPNFEAFTEIQQLPDTPGEYILVFEADYPEGIARTPRRVQVVERGVLQLVPRQGDSLDEATAQAFVDGRASDGFLSSSWFMAGDVGGQTEPRAPSFSDDSWLPVTVGSPILLPIEATEARAGLFPTYDDFSLDERLPFDLLDGASLAASAGRQLLAVEVKWKHGKTGWASNGTEERALFFFPIEVVAEPTAVEDPIRPTPSPTSPAEGAVVIDIRRSDGSPAGEPEAFARLGEQEVQMCPDGWTLVGPDGTSESVVFDCGQSDTFAAAAGTPISVNGDFASIDARAPRLSGSGEGTEFPPGRVPAVPAGSVVSYQWSVSWDDGSTASFWLLLTATGEADDADDPLADAITIKIDDEGAFLEYGNERQMALLGGGYQSETGQLVEWFERAAEVTRFLRVPRGARIEVDTSGGAVFTFAIGRPGSGDGYWIMTDDSEPPYDILRSDNLGPVQYVIELLVQRPDGSWVDAYFGIELFATDVEGSAVVPDVMGLSREEAERLIAESGLGVKVETITSGLPESEVFRVRPVPGAVVFPDTVVTIHVSRPSNDGG